jgi:hypothetical protein
VLLGLAYLALESGDDETARSHVAESLAFDRRSDRHLPQVADDLEMAARLAAACGQLTRAVTIYASAVKARRSSPDVLVKIPHPGSDRLRGGGALVGRVLGPCRGRLVRVGAL